MFKHFAVSLLLTLSAAAAVNAQAVAPDPVVAQFQSRLEAALGGLNPAAAFEVPDACAGQMLVMRYKTREYHVYTQLKDGTLGRVLVAREGPDDGGVLLRVSIEGKGHPHAADVPQTLQEPYWLTNLRIYPLTGTDKQLYVTLSYRGRPNQEMVRTIEQVFEQAAEGGQRADRNAPEAADQNLPMLEGVLKIHPKYLYKYYLAVDGGQISALEAENANDTEKVLGRIAPGTRIRVRGPLVVRHHPGGTAENLSPFGRSWTIFMRVRQIEALDVGNGGKK